MLNEQNIVEVPSAASTSVGEVCFPVKSHWGIVICDFCVQLCLAISSFEAVFADTLVFIEHGHAGSAVLARVGGVRARETRIPRCSESSTRQNFFIWQHGALGSVFVVKNEGNRVDKNLLDGSHKAACYS